MDDQNLIILYIAYLDLGLFFVGLAVAFDWMRHMKRDIIDHIDEKFNE